MTPDSDNPTRQHIVVVEDDENDAMMTTRALRRLDPPPTITVLEDGASAVKSLTGDDAIRPALIFLDLKLPKVHGLEVLKALKEDEDTKNIPVLVLSSSDEPQDVATASSLGCARYLRKPISWPEYMETVSEAAKEFLELRAG